MRVLYRRVGSRPSLSSFFFNDAATAEISTLSLPDALPISRQSFFPRGRKRPVRPDRCQHQDHSRSRHLVFLHADRKSTRLNSSHANISYAVFCLKKKNESGSLQTAFRGWLSSAAAGTRRSG